MFTGIVEEIGRVENIKKGPKSLTITIRGEKIFSDLKVGDSVAVNGVCLTATTIGNSIFTADVMPESIKMTTFTNLKVHQPVNLERAMLANGRFGGHIVAGHVDGTGRIINREQTDNAIILLSRLQNPLWIMLSIRAPLPSMELASQLCDEQKVVFPSLSFLTL